jgi:hypothetical protein
VLLCKQFLPMAEELGNTQITSDGLCPNSKTLDLGVGLGGYFPVFAVLHSAGRCSISSFSSSILRILVSD